MIDKLRETVHNVFLRAKRLRYYVNTQRFSLALEKASNEELKTVNQLVDSGDLKNLKICIEGILRHELEKMPISQLRLLGRQYNIKHYYVLTKEQLIKEIKDAQERYSKDIDSECGESSN